MKEISYEVISDLDLSRLIVGLTKLKFKLHYDALHEAAYDQLTQNNPNITPTTTTIYSENYTAWIGKKIRKFWVQPTSKPEPVGLHVKRYYT